VTYSTLNLFFLAIAAIATLILNSRYQCLTKPVVALPMAILTAVFDNLIVFSGIVAYDESKLIGLKIGVVPIEDFAYTLVAVLLVPAIWKAVKK
jgi:lycopene cyclase domain-containing protein